MENLYARELAHQYQNRVAMLSEEYHRTRSEFPSSDFTAISKLINAAVVLHALWAEIANRMADKPYWEENQ